MAQIEIARQRLMFLRASGEGQADHDLLEAGSDRRVGVGVTCGRAFHNTLRVDVDRHW